ncbi:MAG: hypothetical protein ACK4VZ_04355 [Paracoccaceae bacterium]
MTSGPQKPVPLLRSNLTSHRYFDVTLAGALLLFAFVFLPGQPITVAGLAGLVLSLLGSLPLLDRLTERWTKVGVFVTWLVFLIGFLAIFLGGLMFSPMVANALHNFGVTRLF